MLECVDGYYGYSSLDSGEDYICLETINIADAAIIVVSIFTGLLVLATIVLMILFFIKREDPVIKRAQVYFCEFVAGGSLLSYTSIYTWVTVSEYVFIIQRINKK